MAGRAEHRRLLAVTLALHSQAPPAPSVDRVGYPEGYEKAFTYLYTVDRPDSGQIRVIYGNDKAAAVKPGEVVVEVPVLSILNATAPARGAEFRAGDAWSLQVTNAAPLQPVFLRIVKDGLDLGVSGPYGTTDSSGRLTLSGTFGVGDAASWQEQVVIGSSAADERSAGTISFSVK